MRRFFKGVRRLVFFIVLLLAGPAVAAVTGLAAVKGDWRTASRHSAGIAPDPASTPEAIIQVYGARTFGWRGAFAVHTWIAAKRQGASAYRTYQVIGWRYWHGASPVAVAEEPPDRHWFGARPEVYAERRGADVEAMIDRLEAAVAAYPFNDLYRTWPGPNSNTFTAVIARSLPELGVDLPPTAIGKDYLEPGLPAAVSPSGTGFQVSLGGLFGVMAAWEEGLEVNLLGLSFGIDPADLAIKLPGLGRISAVGD